jgi:DNA polymerase-3 subunit gamma/tau
MPDPPPGGPDGYTVVARRYRPQRFEDVVGQDHVVQALRNAIRFNRVTHAYLFSGTRGVGKTSIARIFAKCLNCVQGPTEEPCLVCDICQAIAVGQDVDVIEIDGASNNGVEAVRDLRQKAGLRPSRARYKIYYIDEVHMLSTPAFNALLKTLEEPPDHVKFFFATTEANKIPITVLSRCQKYDFAGITPDRIAESLAEVCASEGIDADADALRAIARRAGGSMRDAQSLLEQLLSFSGDRLTAELVHRQLGLASDDRTLDLLDALADRDAARTLQLVESAAAAGVQPVELLGGVLDYLRDAMVLAAGADVALLSASPRQRPRIEAVVERLPLDTILAAQQILAEARGRLRGSPHGRLLVELALLRAVRLEAMTELSEVIARLSGMTTGGDGTPVEKKKLRPASPPLPDPTAEPAATAPPVSTAIVTEPPPPALETAPAWELDAILAAWAGWVAGLEPELQSRLGRLTPLAITAPNELAFTLDPAYNWIAASCESAEMKAKIEARLTRWLKQKTTFRVERPEPAVTRSSRSARDETVRNDPIVKQVVEMFEARVVQIDADDGRGG